jgi:hypothetical protein
MLVHALPHLFIPLLVAFESLSLIVLVLSIIQPSRLRPALLFFGSSQCYFSPSVRPYVTLLFRRSVASHDAPCGCRTSAAAVAAPSMEAVARMRPPLCAMMRRPMRKRETRRPKQRNTIVARWRRQQAGRRTDQIKVGHHRPRLGRMRPLFSRRRFVGGSLTSRRWHP